MSDLRANTILNYWLGDLPNDDTFPIDKAEMWFRGGIKVDQYVREQFEEDFEKAVSGELDSWKSTPRERLTLIIILDQFSRNIYRGTPKSFEHDNKALDLTLDGIEKGFDQKLRPAEAIFFYLPLEHSEDIAMQKKSIECFTRLVERATPAIEFPMRNALDYAEQHYKIIDRFGRFPHRNEILKRKSTQEEISFLKQPGSSF